MRISDWCSDVCASDLGSCRFLQAYPAPGAPAPAWPAPQRSGRGTSAPCRARSCATEKAKGSVRSTSDQIFARMSRCRFSRSEESRVGKSVSVRVDIGGLRISKKKTKKHKKKQK